LGGDPDNAGGGQREAELDKADAELRLQQRKQRRQHQMLEMIDEMGGGDQADRPVLGALLAAPAAPYHRLRHTVPKARFDRTWKIRMLTD
jgi:hypothetical protein